MAACAIFPCCLAQPDAVDWGDCGLQLVAVVVAVVAAVVVVVRVVANVVAVWLNRY